MSEVATCWLLEKMQVEGTSAQASLFPFLPHSQDDTWCFLCFLGSRGSKSDT